MQLLLKEFGGVRRRIEREADDEFRKRVAIKLLAHGLIAEELVLRFRNERQTLAALEHPNIVRLLDGGTADDGLPYLVMDYVEGLPIDEYCDSRKLSTSERLMLFRTICGAVHYAHQNLIVHRDLKPANILVTSEGVPKLLDFGIAKLLNPELSTQMLLTRANMRAMTPEYASPEQVRGNPVTTATDVYSLGVLLYELLTGHRPFHLKRYTPAELEHAICEVEPEKPSTAATRPEQIVDPVVARERDVRPGTSRASARGERRCGRSRRGDLAVHRLRRARVPADAWRELWAARARACDCARHRVRRPRRRARTSLRCSPRAWRRDRVP